MRGTCTVGILTTFKREIGVCRIATDVIRYRIASCAAVSRFFCTLWKKKKKNSTSLLMSKLRASVRKYPKRESRASECNIQTCSCAKREDRCIWRSFYNNRCTYRGEKKSKRWIIITCLNSDYSYIPYIADAADLLRGYPCASHCTNIRV